MRLMDGRIAALFYAPTARWMGHDNSDLGLTITSSSYVNECIYTTLRPHCENIKYTATITSTSSIDFSMSKPNLLQTPLLRS